MSTFLKVQDRLTKLREFSLYNVSLVPFNSRDEIHEHVAMMRKMSDPDFEAQYVEMLDLLEKDLESNLIAKYCQHELRWSQPRINKMMEV